MVDRARLESGSTFTGTGSSNLPLSASPTVRNGLCSRLVSHLGRKPLDHLGQDHMGQGTCFVHFGRRRFHETRRISVGPGILAQVIQAVDQQIQRVVDPLALASQGGEIVRLLEGTIMPDKKRLQCFFGRLLAVEESILDVRRFVRKTPLDPAEILPRLPQPRRGVLRQHGIMRHTELCLREPPWREKTL